MTAPETPLDDPKAILRRYLQHARDALVWKLEGVGERDARLPRTPTGLNLAGIVKHVANVEIGYFGLTFGRAWPTPQDTYAVPLEAYADDPQADWYLTADESVAGLLAFYRRVWAFADEQVEALDLGAVGAPPWWGDPSHNRVTLHHMLVRVVDDTARHAGQADILREHLDGAIGLSPQYPNVPGAEVDWAAYRERLTRLAEG